MKRLAFLFITVLCLMLSACSNDFAEKEYHDTGLIAQTGDRYAKQMSVFNQTNNVYTLSVSSFDGRETLWSEKIKEQQLIELSVSMSLSEGMVKLVHIDSGDHVKTIAECTPQTCTDGFVQCDIPLDEGLNRLKLVGYGCKDVKLNIVFPKGFKYC